MVSLLHSPFGSNQLFWRPLCRHVLAPVMSSALDTLVADAEEEAAGEAGGLAGLVAEAPAETQATALDSLVAEFEAEAEAEAAAISLDELVRDAVRCLYMYSVFAMCKNADMDVVLLQLLDLIGLFTR